jgi:hypothetical protein
MFHIQMPVFLGLEASLEASLSRGPSLRRGRVLSATSERQSKRPLAEPRLWDRGDTANILGVSKVEQPSTTQRAASGMPLPLTTDGQ